MLKRWLVRIAFLFAAAAAPAAAQQPPAPQAPGGRDDAQAPQQQIQLLDFRDLPLRNALRMMSEQTGLNIVASSRAADKPVSLYLREVSAEAALDALTQSHNLWYRLDRDNRIVRVFTVEEYQRELGSFREESTEVFTLLYPNAIDVATAVSDLFGDRVRMSFGADDRMLRDDLEERFTRFDLLDQRSQGLGLFESGSGRTGFGLRGGRTDGRGVRQRTDILREQRDRPRRDRDTDLPRQMIEGLSPEEIHELEEALERDDEDAIEDLIQRRQPTIFLTVVRRHNQVVVRTSDERTMEQIRELIRRLDVPTPLVMLEVKIMSIELEDDFTSAFDFQFEAGSTAGGFSGGDIQPPGPDSFQLGGTGLIDGALAFQYVGENFRARLQMLERENRVTTLATPLLLTAHNEVSRLFVGEERPLNRSFSGAETIVPGGGGTIVTPGTTAIEFRPVGTTLLITPSINADRTVTLRILQETSSISPTPAPVLVPSAVGFVEEEVDVVQTRTVSGTIVAKDGLAVGLGGLIEESLVDRRQMVPVLGRIPALGMLFRREETDRSRRELVIMVRPYVLNTPAESEQISRQLLEELSIHPTTPEGRGTLDVFREDEVLTPDDIDPELYRILRFHSSTPDDSAADQGNNP